MEGRIRDDLRVRRLFARRAVTVAAPVEADPTFKLEVNVICTTPQETLGAMSMAAALAKRLDAEINLLALQVVPYQLELTMPMVRIEYLEKRFQDLASKAPICTRVHIVLCREKLQALRQLLKPQSLVVMGSGRSWWPTPERKLARGLRQDGHHVFLYQSKVRSHARFVLHFDHHAVFCRLRPFREGLRQVVGIG